MNTTIIESRRLQGNEIGNDYIMIQDLGPFDGPTKITMCASQNVLTGFQVFYGSYAPKAGAAHGDLTTDCIVSYIDDPIIEVAIYGQDNTNGKLIEGITVTLQPLRDGTYPG